MNVRTLIQKLQDVPDDAEVYLSADEHGIGHIIEIDINTSPGNTWVNLKNFKDKE